MQHFHAMKTITYTQFDNPLQFHIQSLQEHDKEMTRAISEATQSSTLVYHGVHIIKSENQAAT